MKHLFTLILSVFILSGVAQTYNMSNTTISSCSGTVYDPGGTGNYANSQTFTMTICPSTAGSKVIINFTTFATENNYDFLYVYDGNSTAAPSLGVYTGATGPGLTQATAGNTSGCITLRFTSDGSNVAAGFVGAISCTIPCETINSVFNSSSPAPVGGIIKVCQGQSVTFNGSATFSSGSSTGATYSWSFDNGQTGSGTSATTTYTAPGVYVVNLDVTKSGCHNNNKFNQIVQVSTTPSFTGTTVSSSTICLGQTATLIGSVTPTPYVVNCTPPVSGVTYLPDGSGVSYSTCITVDCYNSGQTVTSMADIANICLNMEHSFLDDLDMIIQCPNGQQVSLKDDVGGGGTYLGNPLDDGVAPGGPGIGANYCFAMSGTALLINGPTITSGNPPGPSIAAGTYSPAASFAGLVGCPLNGNWCLKVTDHAALDDGYIFNWDVNFNVAAPAAQSFTPSIVSETWSGSGITGTSGNNATIQPTAPGSQCYTLTALDNFGCTYTTTKCITVVAGPFAGVSNTLAACSSASSTNLFGLLGTGVSTTGTWSGPAPALTGGNLGTFNPGSYTAGTYNYTYTVPASGGCPASTAVVAVTIRPNPSATLTFTNPSCGNTNGIIVIANTSSGGQTISSYASSGGLLSGQTVTGLAAGTDIITLTNNFGCTFTVSATLSNSPPITNITLTPNNIFCGTGTGSITIGAVTGGTPTYSYAVNGGAFSTSPPVTGLATGTYSVSVKDATGCTFTKTVSITNTPGPTAITGSTTQTSCSGNNGTHNVTGVTGGTPAYTYSVDAVATGSLTSGLGAGSHTILVKDANGCTFSTSFVITTTNGPSSFTVASTNASCGTANGTSTVTGVTGGTPTYSFSFDGGGFGTGTTTTGLSAGTHTVTVKDINSCTITATYNVASNAAPTAAVTNSIAVLCNGGSTGSFTVTPSGGTAPFTYTLTSPVQTNGTGTFTGLAAGTYSVLVRDNSGCTATASVTLTQPPVVTGTVSSIPVNCFGNSTGSVSVGGAGGVGPYTYTWPASLGNSTLATVSGVAAGTYTVSIKDSHNCAITQTVTVTQPTSLTLTSTLTPATCGNSNGSGTVTVSGGTPAYTYNWSNGGTAAALSGAPAGTYTLTVHDANGCILTKTVSITNIPGPTAITGTTTLASCNTNNGTYNVTGVTGGTPAYTYSVDAVGTSSLTSGLAAGTHSILVKDANGCTFNTTFNINTANGPSSFTVASTNASCGTANGTSTVTGVAGGTPTYSFSFDGGGFGTGTTTTGLSAGTHTVTVKDINSCTITATYNVASNAAPTAAVTNSIAVLCNGGSTGSFTVTPSGGTAPFTYTLTSPVQTNGTGTFTGLAAGTYSVLVRDNSGCTATASVTLTQPPVVTGTVSSIPVNCFGNSTGSVSVGGAGGVGPYTYTWPASLGNSTLATVSGVAAGTYTVSIKDSHNCAITQTVTVTQPTSLTLTSTLTPATCGNSNGSGTVTVSGGTPAYTYNWNNGDLTNILTAVPASTYSLTVHDANGCVLTATVNITNIPGPTAITGTTSLAGCNLSNGTYSITGVTGGTPAYTYSVDATSTGTLTSGLAAGTHSVSVKDANGCTFNTTFNINTANGPSSATVITTNASCGTANGTSTVTGVTGGVPAYNYSFDGSVFGATTNTTGLAAGSHTVIIRDINSCTLSVTYTELNNSGPTASITSSLNANCFGTNTGSVTVTPSGGIAPFTYTLTAPTQTNTTGNFTGLAAGAYNITVKDNSGCTATASVTLTQPTAVTLTVTSLPASCFGSSTATVSASGGGGVGPYTYVWPALGSSTLASVPNVAAGTYSVTQTDSHGCSITQGVTVTQPTSLTLTSTLTAATCGNSNGSGTVTVSGGTPAYTYSWSNGGITSALSGAPAGTYTLNVTDFKGCILTKTVTVTNIPGPTAITGTTTLAGCNLSNGTYNVTGVTGGTPAYTYSVDATSTSSLTSGLSAGTHTVLVKDANGCTFNTTFTINTANGPTSATVVTTNASCGSANGTSTITGVTGGSAPFQYSFDGSIFAAGTTTAGISAGAHTVVIRDVNTCTLSVSYTELNNSGPTASVSNSININCNGGSTGSFTVTPSGGIAPFTYTLTSPAQTNGTGVFTGLPSGSYNVTIADNSGCTATASVTLTQPTAVTLTVTSLPASCFGSSTGTVSASGGGGVGPYTYVWPALGSSTLASVPNVAAGTYSVTQTDSHGCSITQGVTVTQPTSLTLTSTLTAATCGNSNGSGTVTVSGGTPAYTYSWSNGGITSALSGAPAGTYTLNVTDFKGCILTKTVTVTNIPGPTVITGTTTLAGCNLSNGTYNITGVTGGTAAYTYSVDATSTSSLTSGLSAGTHTVLVKDANGCTFSNTFNIGTTAGPTTASVTASNASCGSANATSTVVSVTGGSSPYQYSFDGSTFAIGTATTGLIAGSHTVTIKDANSCTLSVNYTVLNNGSPIISLIAAAPVLCNGGSTGSFTVAETGGSGAPYTYTLTAPFQTNGNGQFTGLAAGTYTVIGKDVAGCVNNMTVSVTQPVALTLTLGSIPAKCYGTSTGTVNATGGGGTPSYQYQLNGGGFQASTTFTAVPASIPIIQIKDANGCTASQTVAVTQPAALTVSISTQNANCTAANGVASATVAGGTPSYIYSWTGAGGANATTNNIVAGSYTVTVTDINGCSTTGAAVIGVTPGGAAAITGSTNITCNGANNGVLTANLLSPGISPTYSWTPGGQVTSTATNLAPGTYTCKITDFYGCVATAVGSLTQPAPLTAIMNSNNARCYGTSTGTISAAAAGGTGPYTYFWPAPLSNTLATVNNVPINNYTCQITDANNCVINPTIAVTQPSSITLTSSVTPANCNQANGSATITAGGGTPAYTYTWNPSGSTSPAQSGLSAGTYSINVKDANNCSYTVAATIPNLAGPSVSVTSFTNVSCFGGNNGSALAAGTGGTGTLTYLWNTSQPTPLVTNQLVGIHTVTVTDATGCVASASVNISQPPVLTANITPNNPKCFGSSNGNGLGAASGGAPGYTYAWTGGGGTNPTSNPLPAGSYALNVTDANGCVATATMALVNPPAMAANITSTNVSCFNSCNGTAVGTTTNNIGVVTYYWIGGPGPVTAQTVTGLCAGNYTLTATDQNSCTASAQVIITQPAQLTASISSTGSITCNGGTNGSAQVTAGGGTGAYTYVWTGAAASAGNSANANSLPAGTYSVLVTDQHSCTATAQAVVIQPAPLATTLTTTNPKCFGSADGTGNIAFTGGSGSVGFIWYPGLQSGPSPSVNNLTAGSQSVAITYNGSCTSTLTFTLTQPSVLTAAVTSTNSNCGQSNGSANAVVGGGTTPYSYIWSNGPTTLPNAGILAGGYTFIVTDANNCTATAAALVNDIAGPSVVITSTTAVKCFGGNDGAATSSITGGVTPYAISWNNNPATTGNVANFLSGIHIENVVDAAGCVGTASINITQPTLLGSAVTSHVDVSCFGLTNGQATMQVTGGTTAYTYSWTPSGQTSAILANVGANTYTCNVKDANNCATSQVVTITEPQALIMTASSFTNISCFGSNNGQISTSVQGGTPGYTYSWTPSQSNSGVLGGLTAGGYSLTVTDSHTCSINANFTILEPSALTSSYLSSPAKCGIANGSGTITVGGGTPSYTINWNTPGLQQGPVGTGMGPGNNWHGVITDSKGCSITQTVAIANAASPVITSVNTIPPTCFGNTDGSIIVNYNLGTPSYTVDWSNPIVPTSQVTSATSATATGVGPGSFTMTITDLYGCTVGGFANVSQPNILVLNVPAPQTICYGQTAQIYATGSGGTFPYSYTWTPVSFTGPGPHAVTPTVTTLYNVNMTDAHNCITAPQVITVNVTPQLLVTGNSYTVCHKDAAILTPNITSPGNGGPYTYGWSNNTTGATALVIGNYPASPNHYTVTVSDGCSLPAATAVFTVVVNPLPTGNFTASTLTACAPANIALTATSGSSTDTYTWYNGKNVIGTTNPINFSSPKADSITVKLHIVNTFGCVFDTVKPNYIIIHPKPVASFIPNPQNASILDPSFTFTNTSGGASAYSWSFGDQTAQGGTNFSMLTNPSHTYGYVGTYTINLVVTNIYGCTDQTDGVVEVTPDFVLYIPNSFTPDGNNLNDFFQPSGVGVNEDNYRMDIFDRWGENIFSSNNFRKGWDGSVKGSGIAEQNVYIYKIMVYDLQGNRHEYVGHVTVLRAY